MSMDGVLVIDKPEGPTSHDVVARVRRVCGTRRVGHTGTLDPMATGVLPLVLGRATRLSRFVTQSDKAYEAEIRLGLTSDTYDAMGRTPPADEPPPGGPGARATALPHSMREIEEALRPFRGSFLQTPPAFSAKKVDGVRAYARAREGQRVDLAPVPVTVHALELLGFEGDRVTVRIDCSAGFYVRALAHELGERLGCGARLEALRRVRSGPYELSVAVALDTLERDPGLASSHLIPVRDLLPSLRTVVVNPRGARRVAHGHDIDPGDIASAGAPEMGASDDASPVRLVDEQGSLLAIGTPEPGGELLHPSVVLI